MNRGARIAALGLAAVLCAAAGPARAGDETRATETASAGGPAGAPVAGPEAAEPPRAPTTAGPADAATPAPPAYAPQLTAPSPAPARRPIYKRWWFWTAIAVAAVATTAIIVASQDSRDPPNTTFGDMGAFK